MASNNDRALLKVIGLVLLVGGLGMAWWGHQMSQSVASQFSRAMTGALPDAVMYRYIGGAAAAVVGLFLLVRK